MATLRTITVKDTEHEWALKELELMALEARLGTEPLTKPFTNHAYIDDSGDLYYYDGTEYILFSAGSRLNLVNATSDYSASNNDYVSCDGTFDVTLPASGQVIVSNRGEGIISIVGTVDGDSDLTLDSQYDTGQFVWNSTADEWETH